MGNVLSSRAESLFCNGREKLQQCYGRLEDVDLPHESRFTSDVCSEVLHGVGIEHEMGRAGRLHTRDGDMLTGTTTDAKKRPSYSARYVEETGAPSNGQRGALRCRV